MNNAFIRKNINTFAIIIFLITFIILNYLQPGFIYNNDGSLRTFGLGHRRKTILPIWLISIILGILSYLIILYYITLPKFR
jgi:uncharacterized membrane protein YozB (DUF420 family)|uniref:Uncharacterized protein n=1 Tax=viral metagenome TaxID=1070528 RepID=A0A6C0CLE7_9ZZZZ